jgi:hypothetical protein
MYYRVLRIYRIKREKITGRKRRLRNEELYDLHPSPNFIQVMKSIINRWTGHVALMGKRREA